MRIFLIILLFISFYGKSQEFRSYVDNANEADKICAAYAGKGFDTDKAAKSALEKILSTIGASKSLVLSSCENIPNAMAISMKGVRYIFYNKEFMSEINTKINYWSNMSILAHEVGHHINGHTTDALLILNDIVEVESLEESRKMELEADEFSGFVLAKLGATLTQATEAIALISSNEDDSNSTHPSKSKRMAAIEKGFNKGYKEIKNNNYSNFEEKRKRAREFYMDGMDKRGNNDLYGAINDYSKIIEMGWVPKLPIKENAYFNKYPKDAYTARGLLKINLKDYYGAIADLTNALEFEYGKYQRGIYRNRAYCKFKLENFTEALKDYNKAIELEDISSFKGRGEVKFILKDFYGAIIDYNKHIENVEDSKSSHETYFLRALAKAAVNDNSGSCEDVLIFKNYMINNSLLLNNYQNAFNELFKIVCN